MSGSDAAEKLEIVLFTGGAMTICPLPSEGRVTLGRAEGNDVRIRHPSVSRNHAALHIGPPLRIEDLGGANGTFVRDPDGCREPGSTMGVRQVSGKTVEIAIGDGVTLGSTMIAVRRAPKAETEETDPSFVIGAPAMLRLYEQAALAAETPISVLLLGETGVGKEVLARAIHKKSPRRAAPFLGLNCSALSESLLESELFGHEKGAFTGAVQARPGLFEAANGGTVFLDEIGELPHSIQVKLLRVIESREVMRVGSRAPTRIDVRFVSATNRDLKAEATAGTFRQDLYFRLDGMTLTIPPLRERIVEIAPLARRFAASAARDLARPGTPELSAEAVAALERHPWPGNVRELRNAIERAIVLCRGDAILVEHLPPDVTSPPPRTPATGDAVSRLRAEVAAEDRERIAAALHACAGNQTKAAALLGVSRRTLVARLGAHDLPRPRKKAD